MIKTGSLAISAIILLILAACNLGSPNTLLAAQATPSPTKVESIDLTVQADTSAPLNAVGQQIKYTYRIKAKGGASASGAVSVTAAGATCPAINTVGNNDDKLEASETLVCSSTHPITQADLDAGSVTTVTTATVGVLTSKPVATTVQFQKLALTKTANPTTYNQAGQTITYSYTITNSTTANLSATQYSINDSGLPAPFNCGPDGTSLAPGATVTCTATYTITANDLNAPSLTHEATATGNGAGTSQLASTTITKGAVVQNNPGPVTNPNPNNLAVGSTVQHKVADGEWIWQIAVVLWYRPEADHPGESADNRPGGNLAKHNPGSSEYRQQGTDLRCAVRDGLHGPNRATRGLPSRRNIMQIRRYYRWSIQAGCPRGKCWMCH